MSEVCLFSLVIPCHNEGQNIPALISELSRTLPSYGSYEVIAVDDGSTDRTFAELAAAKEGGATWLRVMKLESQVGQSGALCAGFDAARGNYISVMDGDLQNDPSDMKEMLCILEEGNADFVSGIRIHRQDNFIRRLSSKFANRVRNMITGDRIIDSACGLKAFRREAWQGIPRFNGMHRFMPTLFKIQGWRVTQIPVNHRRRHAGRPKYGIGNRAWRGLVDTFGIRWLQRRSVVPKVTKEV